MTLLLDHFLQVNAVLCTLAFAGLSWRLVGRWTVTDHLGRTLVMLLAGLELIVAMTVARRAALGGPFNEAQWLIVAHALLVLVVVALWPRLARVLDVETDDESRVD